MLEFIVPIVHPSKPTHVTRTIENTIFGALDGERSEDWQKIFVDLVHRLVGGAGKTKPTPICPSLYHLYESQGLLTEEEETDYRAAQELTRYRITLESEPESIRESEDEVRVITAPESLVQQAKVQQPPQWPNQRRKQTYRAPTESPPVRSRGEGSCLQPEPEARPKPQQTDLVPFESEEQKEEPQTWMRKLFDELVNVFQQLKG